MNSNTVGLILVLMVGGFVIYEVMQGQQKSSSAQQKGLGLNFGFQALGL